MRGCDCSLQVSSACGYGVPEMKFEKQRDSLLTWSEKQGPEGMKVRASCVHAHAETSMHVQMRQAAIRLVGCCVSAHLLCC